MIEIQVDDINVRMEDTFAVGENIRALEDMTTKDPIPGAGGDSNLVLEEAGLYRTNGAELQADEYFG
jgi:hypothetical protein